MNEYNKAIKTPIADGGVGWYSIGQEELDAVTSVLKNPKSMWRYQSDSYCNRLESRVREITGAQYALFVNSGTSALACCLTSQEVGPGDEVIVSGYTYIATASACLEVGAVPVICEIDDSLGIDLVDLERKITPQTKAVIVTHMQGVPSRLEAIRAVTKKHGLRLIEDCCQAIGARYKGKYCGMEADAFAWSLNYFKIITCGEGGIFFTNDDKAFARGYFQSDPAGKMWKNGRGEDIDVLSFTRACYRASELCGAVAFVQAGRLEGILEKTRALKKALLSRLAEPIHYKKQYVDDPEGDCGISYAMIANDDRSCRLLTEALAREGLSVGSAYNPDGFPDRHIFKYWAGIVDKNGANPMHYPWNDPQYKGHADYGDTACPQTLDILSRSLRLGIHLAMTEQNMTEIAEAINKADKSI